MSNTQNEKKSVQKGNFVNHVGFEVLEKKNNILLKLDTKSWHLNSNKFLHGGVTATMLDTALGISIKNVTGKNCITINLNISYLKPVIINDIVVSSSEVIQTGNNIATAESNIGLDGDIIAKAIGTFKLIG